MPQEIERKFLVANDTWREQAKEGRRLRQAYLAEAERAVVRVRLDDGVRAVLTIKSTAAELARQEFEYDLPVADAEALLDLRVGSVVEKTRFQALYAGRVWEIDIYHGPNAGLIITEVELEDPSAVVELPPWAGREVTGEAPFYASRLAQHPFQSWSGQGAS